MPDRKNIQGDTWPRLPKKAEKFIFFRITNVKEFKKGLPMMADFITTGEAALRNRSDIFKRKAQGIEGLIQGLVSFNIAFSANGLAKLGAEKLNDDFFNGGQFKDMTAPEEGQSAEDHQGLDAQGEWVPEFKPSSGGIDGVLTVTGESPESIEKWIKKTFNYTFNVDDKQSSSVEIVYVKEGKVFKNHEEHFGWADGISQPIIKGLDDISVAQNVNGMKPIDPGVIFVGSEGDESKNPEWAKDGSFMVFRIYEQLVPEFYHWCARNCPIAAEETKKAQEQGKEVSWSGKAMDQMGLFSSRLESFPAPSPILEILIKHNALGAPMEVHPLEDPNHSKNKDQPWFTTNNMKTLNNTDDFNYNPSDQTKCPYASHMRKTGPRDDYPDYNKHVMIRRGIPYGEWCSDEERASGTTQHERGLLFVSYQSSIENGFVTQQKRWANSPDGPTDMAKHNGGVSQGIDPIIGQVHPSRNGKSTGDQINAKYQQPPQIPFPDSDLEKPAPQVYDKKLDLDRIVVPHGGEYFFTPSIEALKNYLPNRP
ncbi:hypothetical protein N7489_008207 [Penicillium chrysogenum]|uniref:uncharacterized protein n=1 Tax=Penicillium chrysogenum TaxID=5076 RepID=UPI00239439CF|nr:uncharacterized protein N7489_008207 [Penicillium chrysogenum]KAJ5238116.1 hypothetical protein N7489_008207 [Penicillium chrysogenum]KAJ5278417.1 hypothetical protein N7524_004570 [Penicillium chrysogenum]